MRLFGLVLLIFSIRSAASPQLNSSLTNNNIPAFHVEGLGIPSVIKQIAMKTGVEIGLETDVTFGKEVLIKQDFSGGSVEDLARLCASLLSNAKWSIDSKQGIIVSTPGYASSLGNLSFAYPGEQGATLQVFWSSLQDVGSLNTWLEAHQCRRTELLRGNEWQDGAELITIPTETTTLQKVLQKAASQAGRKYWSILENKRASKCEVNITFW